MSLVCIALLTWNIRGLTRTNEHGSVYGQKVSPVSLFFSFFFSFPFLFPFQPGSNLLVSVVSKPPPKSARLGRDRARKTARRTAVR